MLVQPIDQLNLLANGDVNDDNIIDAFDFTIMMQAYDIAEDSAIGESDLNNDEIVDAFDFTIMMLSYDSAGDRVATCKYNTRPIRSDRSGFFIC